MIRDEASLECEICGCFNLINGVIIDGNVYCLDCYKKIKGVKKRLEDKLK